VYEGTTKKFRNLIDPTFNDYQLLARQLKRKQFRWFRMILMKKEDERDEWENDLITGAALNQKVNYNEDENMAGTFHFV